MHAWINHPEPQPGVIRGNLSDFALEAMTAKAALYGPSAEDLVLVILFDLRRYDDFDLEEMRCAMRRDVGGKAKLFREVWSVWCFEDRRGESHCLWRGFDASTLHSL